MKDNTKNTYGMKEVLENGKKNIRSYTMILALLIIWIILGTLTKGTFFMPRNLSMLVRQTSITGILALGMLLVVITGNIDMSAGSAMGFLGGIAACCQVWYELGVVPTILIVLAGGLLIGMWNGLWVAYMKVPAFIVTLGGYLAFRGMLIGLTKSVTISPMSEKFKAIGQGYLPMWMGWAAAVVLCVYAAFAFWKERSSKMKYGFSVPDKKLVLVKCVGVDALILLFMYVMSLYQGVPIPVAIMLVLAGIFTFLTKCTRFGRSVYAIGCSKETAELAGINTKRILFFVYMIMGAMSGIAGVILTARLNAGTAGAGNMAEMDAIASCVIGGASLAGGVGSIPASLIGALVMVSLDNGMSLLNTESFWQYIVKGVILIGAVWVDITTKKRAA